MPRHDVSIDDLNEQLRDLGLRYHQLKHDDLFVLWFIRAYLTDDEQVAASALAGGSRDKSVDAILIDNNSRDVTLIQGKHRKHLNEKSEKREDVQAFAQLATVLTGEDKSEFNAFLQTMEPRSAELLKQARDAILKQQFRLRMYYVTLGRITPSVRADAVSAVRLAQCRDKLIDLFDGDRTMELLRDYLDGVAPPIPSLELEVESGKGVERRALLDRRDTSSNIQSYVFPMRGDELARIAKSAGRRLFARNIRGFLGTNTPINEGMVKTLRQEPENFFHFNNGVTMVCDDAEHRTQSGRDVVLVSNPQVINGQQTTRVLGEHEDLARNASVLVKVIRVPRKTTEQAESRFNDLIAKIVAATNWQNKIGQADLMSNDRKQIEIERALRKRNILYLRKAQSKHEAVYGSPIKPRLTITKFELALASAGCELDPFLPRSGKDNLFNEDNYGQVFPSTDAMDYLLRYAVYRQVRYCSKGKPERAYFTWLVLGFVWRNVAPLIRARVPAEGLFEGWMRNDGAILGALNNAIELVFRDAKRFYRANRGEGEEQKDPSVFTRTRGLQRRFEEFWERRQNAASRKKLVHLISRLAKELAV